MTKRQRVRGEDAIGRISSAVWDAEEIGIITDRKAGQLQRILTEATEKKYGRPGDKKEIDLTA